VIPIAEEVARVEKREAVTGRVRVRTHVDVVHEPVRASLEQETVEVTRVPIDREITQAPEVRTENGVTIVPVVEEVLVVEKRLVLKEELHIRRHVRTEDVEVPVELRKERVEVERIPLDDVESGTRQVEAGRVPPEDVKSGEKQVEVERIPVDDDATNPQRVKR
jgi:stress response protein YsnF